jgi:two-component system sensor histidine kinase VanS
LTRSYTKELLNSYNIAYIKSKITAWNLSHTNLRFNPGTIEYLPLFHVYNKYSIPTKYVAQVTVYSDYNGNKRYVAVTIPDVFTSKSSGILKTYITYIILFLMFLTLIVSIIASYFVARPVIKINKTASKIANLDFSEKCIVKNTDEIGNLAKTINTMSDNLQDALTILNNANKKLNKDLDMQKELEKLRQEFLGAVTHELKTPITLIKGYTESIMDNVAEGEEKELALKIIVEETENMDKLVRDLLDLSGLESMGYVLNISEFYINELIDKICTKYKKIIVQRNIQLNNTVNQNILVEGDNFRIEQVMSNFISNAIDHTMPQKSITISTEIIAGTVIISIHNEGQNILESEINRIWEKFYRVEKSRNKKLGGTGLGLAVSKSILELHKSQYGVKNTDDGVTFFFSLEILEH